MKFTLRDYQEEGCGAIIDAVETWGYDSVIATAATGSGKTVLFASLIHTFLESRYKILVMAPHRDLINQAYLKIRDMCDLKEEYNEIDKEMGTLRFNPAARVVVGCINTCYKETRLLGWKPDIIICDEAHFCISAMWTALFNRFPEAIKIGLTATAGRGDRQPVFHEGLDGTKTRVEEKGSKEGRETTPEECAFIRHVYDYPLADAINDGWLIEPRVYVAKSKLNLSRVKSTKNSQGDTDFNLKELNAELTKDQKTIVDRINTGITKWKQIASDRPTIVFCPSVEYAHWAANLWIQAGYKAAAYDCETDTSVRDCMVQDIKDKKVQVVTNFGLFTHGTDVPEWSCEVILRPTESSSLLSQIIGRITRPDESIAHILGTLPTREERHALIAASPKPDSIVIDVVDIVGKHKLATVPTILGLPAQIDLQGHKLTEAAALVREFDAAKKRVNFECPATYEELEATLHRIRLLDGGARSRDAWIVSPDGSYTNGHTPPGYVGKLEKDGEKWKLSVVDCESGEIVYQKQAERRQGKIEDYFDSADAAVQKKVEEHRKAKPPKSTGMYQKVLNAQRAAEATGKRDPRLFYLERAGFDKAGIDTLHEKQVRAIVQKEREKYWEKKNGAQQASA